MSGGHFDYIQYRFSDVAESIRGEIVNNNKPPYPNPENQWEKEDNKYFFEHGGRKWTDVTIKEFEKGMEYVRLAQIYTQRIDWLLSGDDGEESFHQRLKEDLAVHEARKKIEFEGGNYYEC